MQGAVPINRSMSNGEYNEVESNKDELKRIIETLTSSKKMIGLLCVSTSFPSNCSESRGTGWGLVYWTWNCSPPLRCRTPV